MAAFAALGLGLVLTTSVERLTSGNYRDSVEALYAADAAIELAARELAAIADWDRVLTGAERSRFTDGPPDGSRPFGSGSVNLTVLTNELTCGRPTVCPDARIRLSTLDRPWGANNPRWELFVFGLLSPVCRRPAPDRAGVRHRLDRRRRARSGREPVGRRWRTGQARGETLCARERSHLRPAERVVPSKPTSSGRKRAFVCNRGALLRRRFLDLSSPRSYDQSGDCSPRSPHEKT